ncbi:uncharacterized protein [Rutidosis leptorrhynchoides]|uniref:uncharacterized protein n=1 Tax=Rutidosis leptorrhynchoides TaxID=125765 RepID=UPI003A9A3FF4
MDRTEQDMKFVGFFGIIKQSFKSIFSSKKIFTQLTLTSILPLTVIFIVQFELAHHFFWRIENNSLPYDTNDSRESTALEWLYYVIFKIIYVILLTLFSVLATSTVVFTTASVYVDRDVVFPNVMKVVPRVWKKLVVTFGWIYLTAFVYDVITEVVIAIYVAIFGYSAIGTLIMIGILIIFLIGFLYLCVVWQLASVVTVLEDISGLNAMKKGKYLANGKKKVGMGITFVLCVFLSGLVLVYFLFVPYGHKLFSWPMIARVMMAILCGVLLMFLFLMVIVTQTVLYLVCKSYHREVIDKVSLSTFLGAYMDETMVYPKAGEEIQLGRPQSQSPV